MPETISTMYSHIYKSKNFGQFFALKVGVVNLFVGLKICHQPSKLHRQRWAVSGFVKSDTSSAIVTELLVQRRGRGSSGLVQYVTLIVNRRLSHVIILSWTHSSLHCLSARIISHQQLCVLSVLLHCRWCVVVVNFLKVCCYRSRLVFNCCF